MIKLRTMDEVDITGKRVVMRVDFNVPLKEGKVADDNRIEAHYTTIKEVLEKAPKSLTLLSHLGRPKGKVVDDYSLKPVAKRLAEKYGLDVHLAPPSFDDGALKLLETLKEGQILMLENTRFHPGETKNDPELAKFFASFGEVFISDAFSVAHRSHASNVGITEYLPSFAGRVMEREVSVLSTVKENPKPPFMLLLGGAKVSDKIGIIETLIDKVDKILIGGGMAFTFLKAEGYEIGSSLLEPDKIDFAKKMLDDHGDKIVLPVDVVVSKSIDDTSDIKVVAVDNIPSGYMGLDVGDKTVKLFKDVLKDAEMVLWNGPLGVFEKDEFAKATKEIAYYLTEVKAQVVVGGGDTAAAVRKFDCAKKYWHVSTGGGASLEFFEKDILPGVKPLVKEE